MTFLPYRHHHPLHIIAVIILAVIARTTIALSVTPTANNQSIKYITRMGRTAFVTGAIDGIGRHKVNKLASLTEDQNLRLLVHGRKPNVGAELVKHNGNRFYHHFSSVSSYCMVCVNFILIGVVVSLLLIRIPRVLLTLLHDFVGLS